MQQHISPEWLDELTAEEQDILREMWEPNVGDRFAHYWTNGNDEVVLAESLVLAYAEGDIYDGGGIIWRKDASLPLLSIGEMIELLIEHGNLREDEAYPCLVNGKVLVEPKIGIYWECRREGKELARALWEAVKEVIKAKARGE
jgi:hypothetical protein